MNLLRLSLDRDPDGTAELIVELRREWFSGKSSAWFSPTAIEEFGLRLAETYPLTDQTPVELFGGYWSADGKRIDQLHVGLKVYPIGSTGTVGVQVHLATARETGMRAESRSEVVTELTTNYEELRRFGLAVQAVAKGTSAFAELAE